LVTNFNPISDETSKSLFYLLEVLLEIKSGQTKKMHNR